MPSWILCLRMQTGGEGLDYNWYLLPMGRLAKAYSAVLNLFGRVGPVPEGMNAAAALRNKWFSNKHQNINKELVILVEQFERDKRILPAVLGTRQASPPGRSS